MLGLPTPRPFSRVEGLWLSDSMDSPPGPAVVITMATITAQWREGVGRGWLCQKEEARSSGEATCLERPLAGRELGSLQLEGGAGGGFSGLASKSCSLEVTLPFLRGGWVVANKPERLPALAVGVFQAAPASGLGERTGGLLVKAEHSQWLGWSTASPRLSQVWWTHCSR